MTDYTNVSARALIVTLSISFWGGRKYDRAVSVEVNEDKHAQADASRVNKHLLVGAAEHKAVLSAVTSARLEHYRQTLPWTDEGARLLATDNYFAYTDAMRRRRGDFDRAIDVFVAAYPRLHDEAAARLGRMYRASDFPSPNEARARFAWALDYAPVPSAGDLRVDLPSDQLAQIEQVVTNRVEQAARAAMRDAWRRLQEAVARVHKATHKDGVVRGNLIAHLRDTVDVLGRLNVAQNEDLEAMRQRVLQELSGIEAADLRTDDALRADTRRRAGAIVSAMSAFYAPAPSQEVA